MKTKPEEQTGKKLGRLHEFQHLERAYLEFKDKELDFFKHRESVFKKQCLNKGGMFFQQANASLKASYKVCLMITKQKKAHTIGENLVLPAAKVMIHCVFGDESVKKINSISLSNNTVQQRIDEMSVDILQQVISDICRLESGFAIQLDESTDVTNCAQLLIFVRYVGKEGVKEEFLMNVALKTTTKGDDIFQMVNSFFKQHGLKWENLRDCTMDGAPARLGQKSGFRACVMEVAPHVKFLHCMIHRFALSCKVLPAEFFDVLSLVIKMVNNVKGSVLNSRLFKILCEDLGADHSVLLFHSNVLCFSGGNVTNVCMSFVKNCWDFSNNSTNVKLLSLP